MVIAVPALPITTASAPVFAMGLAAAVALLRHRLGHGTRPSRDHHSTPVDECVARNAGAPLCGERALNGERASRHVATPETQEAAREGGFR
jgi:hypothetical protein